MSETKWRECNDPEVLAAAVAAGVEVQVKAYQAGEWRQTRQTTASGFLDGMSHGHRYRVPADWQPAPEPPADESDPPEVKRRTRREVTVDFIEGTRTIREWVNGGGVNGPSLCEELDAWLDYWGGWTPDVIPADEASAAARTDDAAPREAVDRSTVSEEGMVTGGKDSGSPVTAPEPPADDLRERIKTTLMDNDHPTLAKSIEGSHYDRMADAVLAVLPAPPVPPWPGAVLSGLVDEDGQPTWLALAGQVRGEQVRCAWGAPWFDSGYYHQGDNRWVEVRAPRPEPERVSAVSALADGLMVNDGNGHFFSPSHARPNGDGSVSLVRADELQAALIAPDGTVEVLRGGGS